MKLPVNKRAFVRACTAQFNTEIPDGLQHLLCSNLTAAAGAGFPVHFACRLGPAHDSSRSMNGAVVSIFALYAILSFYDYGYIPHAAADKTNLAGRGCLASCTPSPALKKTLSTIWRTIPIESALLCLGTKWSIYFPRSVFWGSGFGWPKAII
ncbi:hypothetical protein AMQ83_16730 [Paenibacillus riograndensis]|nr:hypothetical protein AMQ83_16730 [Paenibacillus riograndensis]